MKTFPPDTVWRLSEVLFVAFIVLAGVLNAKAANNTFRLTDGLQNVTVKHIYNKEYDKIQLNISWSTSEDFSYIIDSYNLEVTTGENDCPTNLFYQTTISKDLQELIVPREESNNLTPGCLYKVRLKIYYEDLHQEQVFTEYHIPDYGDICRSENFTPKVQLKSVSILQNDTLNITWTNEEEFKDDSINVPEIDIVNDSGNSTNLSCKITKQNANNALIGCDGIIDGTVNNTLKVVFINKRNCSKIISFQMENISTIEINSSTTPLSSNGEIVTEGGLQVSNIIANAVYSQKDLAILLNISWTRPTEYQPKHYDFKVTSNPNNSLPHCDYRDESFLNDGNLTSILLPKFPSEGESLLPGCSYIIWIKSRYSDEKTFVSKFYYTIPDCVGEKCSCKAMPKASITNILILSSSILNVSWADDNFRSIENYNITNVEFKYRSNDTYNHQNCEIKENFTNAALIKCEKMTKRHNVLYFSFTNNFGCKVTVNRTFEVDEDIDNADLVIIHQREIKKHALIMIITFFAMFVLLTGILYCNRHIIMRIIMKKLGANMYRANEIEIYDSANRNATRSHQCYNVIYCETEIVDGNTDKFEIPRGKIRLQTKIDSGAFGQVFLAKIFAQHNGKPFPPVAVKTLRDDAPPEEVQDFLSEINILKKVGEHPNIVKLIGCCTLRQPYMMVMELVPCGSLRNYLLELRKEWERKRQLSNDSVFLDNSDGAYISPNSPNSPTSTIPSNRFPSLTETEYTNLGSEGTSPLIDSCDNSNSVEPILDHTELQNFAFQIAKGMAYLEQKQITHRDLAARNVLINESKTLKISDFGLSRVGPYINSKTKKLPLRWMAIESIENNFYNNKTDVWSFGIVLWEIGSLGAIPYQTTPNSLILHNLLQGRRLERPGICTDDLYSTMLKCWCRDPLERPSFAELAELLEVKKRQIYVDFSRLNPTYEFPPVVTTE